MPVFCKREITTNDVTNSFFFCFFKCVRFVELASKDRFAALEYLQTDLSDIIDHSNKDQTKEVGLVSLLLLQKFSLSVT